MKKKAKDMSRTSVIEIFKEKNKFSAAHFTIFSKDKRENLHGHNYQVYLSIECEIIENGLSFDYRFYKKKLYELCRELNEYTLLPTESEFLKIHEEQKYYRVIFDDEELFFLKRDVKLLPICNITLEELSMWFIKKLIPESTELKKHRILSLCVKVFSAPGQSGSSSWSLHG